MYLPKSLMMLFLPLWLGANGLDAGRSGPGVAVCPADPDPPAYYRFELVSTRRVPGAGQAVGTGAVSFEPSPLGISLAPDGSYQYRLDVSIERLRPAKNGAYVVWVATPNLDHIQRLGTLGDDHRLTGTVAWNKFIVIVTLETDPDAGAGRWSGPVVLRGLSRSGLMHTMAGHGPYESEPCAVYGY